MNRLRLKNGANLHTVVSYYTEIGSTFHGNLVLGMLVAALSECISQNVLRFLYISLWLGHNYNYVYEPVALCCRYKIARYVTGILVSPTVPITCAVLWKYF